MKKSILYLHSRSQIGVVDPRIFGGFLEHMGRAIYEGVYEPGSRHADENGFRKDVLGALRDLDMTAMRYPGGNFASGYHWLDGVGPRDRRPILRELAWQSTEPNLFGTDEYIKLCRTMKWTPMLTANMGTGTPEEARNWVEYCNSPAGTKFADMRVANGNSDPFAVKLWCLGNEMDGEWQLGHVPAAEYAVRAQQAAKMMKDTDKSIELVACGSCGMGMSTYMEWDQKVLEHIGDFADYISLHRYVDNHAGDTPNFLAVSNSIDRQIEEMDAACRFVQARRKSSKRAFLCFDEWNVWYKNMQMDGEGKFAPHLIEEVYNLEDALVVAGFLHSFVRHADTVKIANLAQIVNIIAPILTSGDHMLIQSIYYPFEMFSKRRSGISLNVMAVGDSYESKDHGVASYADTSAILDGGRLNVFITNRSVDEPLSIVIKPADLAIGSLVSGEILTASQPNSVNTYEEPNVVKTANFGEVNIKNGGLNCELPPLSFVALTLNVS